MTSIKRKFSDISAEEKFETFIHGTIYIGGTKWRTLLILILATKFNSLCLLNPEIIDEKGQLIHHHLPKLGENQYDIENYGRRKVEPVDTYGIKWQVVERKNREGKSELTGVLLLPLILQDSFENFYNATKSCLERGDSKHILDRPNPYTFTILDRNLKRRRIENDYDAILEGEEFPDIENPKYILSNAPNHDSKGSNHDSKGSKYIEYDPYQDDNYVPSDSDTSDDSSEEEDTTYEGNDEELPFKVPVSKNVSRKGPRYIIMPMGIVAYIRGNKNGHAIVLVFDRKTAKIYHFDPNGDSEIEEYLENEMLKQIKKAFQGFYKNLVYPESRRLPLVVRASKRICISGPQAAQEETLESSEDFKIFTDFVNEKHPKSSKKYIDAYKYKMSGTCTVWSFIYMYLLLYYPDAESEDIIRIMIKKDLNLNNILSKIVHILSTIIITIIEGNMEYADIIKYIKQKDIQEALSIEKFFDKP